MLTGVDHFTILVEDLDGAARTYEALLGVAPSWRGEHPELGLQSALFGMFNGLIELVGPLADDDRAEGMRQRLAAFGEGLHALAFTTDDAATCRSWLREQGLKAAPPERGTARSLADGSERSYTTVELSPRSTHGLNLLAVERDDTDTLRGPQTRPAAAVDAIDHVVIRTANPERSIALFGHALGIRLALDRDFGTRMLFFRIGKLTLEVIQDDKVGEQDHFWGLAYRVRDIDGARSRMQQAGLSVGEVRDGNKPGTRVFTVRDGTNCVPTLVLRDPARD